MSQTVKVAIALKSTHVVCLMYKTSWICCQTVFVMPKRTRLSHYSTCQTRSHDKLKVLWKKKTYRAVTASLVHVIIFQLHGSTDDISQLLRKLWGSLMFCFIAIRATTASIETWISLFCHRHILEGKCYILRSYV